MNKIKNGDVYSFEIGNMFGLVQIISKSDYGYKVRVFEKPVLNLNNLEEIILSKNFYYLKRFYKNDLINYGKYLGNFIIPSFVTFPKYLRSSERKVNGKLVWYIFDDKNKIVKTFTKFDESLKELSPYRAWGISYIKLRWEEGFTLENWNDDLENKWYFNYLKQYEPNKINKPTNNWVNMNEEAKKNISDLLDNFIDKILNKNEDYDLIINNFIKELNKINAKYLCIETSESEELLEYLSSILSNVGLEEKISLIDEKRNW